ARGGEGGWASGAANGASRNEEEEIKGEPTEEQQRYGDAGDNERAHRSVPQRRDRFLRPDRGGDLLWPSGGRVMGLVGCHRFGLALATFAAVPSGEFTCWK